MSYNLPYLIDRDTSAFNTTQNHVQIVAYDCHFKSIEFVRIVKIMHIVNTVTLPFTLMLVSTILVIIGIYKSKNRLLRHQYQGKLRLARRRALQNRDIKFSFTLITLNLIFLVFNLPLAVSYLTVFEYNKQDPYRGLTFAVTRGLYYSSFATPFFIYLASNSMFCREFFLMLNPSGASNDRYFKSTIGGNSIKGFNKWTFLKNSLFQIK